MIRTILEEVKAKGFEVNQIIMDHDTSGGNIACSVFQEVRITYRGNHNAKSFHHDLMKIKLLQGKTQVMQLHLAVIVFNSVHHHVKLQSTTS